jgi:hypothetical protein
LILALIAAILTKSNKQHMSQDQLNRCIEQALDNLSFLNEMLFDFWLTELYEDGDEIMIPERWNEETLAIIEKDVMMQELAN